MHFFLIWCKPTNVRIEIEPERSKVICLRSCNQKMAEAGLDENSVNPKAGTCSSLPKGHGTNTCRVHLVIQGLITEFCTLCSAFHFIRHLFLEKFYQPSLPVFSELS